MRKMALVMIVLSLDASARVVTCSQTSLESNASIIIDLDNRGVNSMRIKQKLTEIIYSAQPAVRGAFVIEYCNPNENEFRDYNNSYSLYSVCTSSQMQIGKVFFEADFSLLNGGSVSYLKADGSEQTISFSSCD